MDLAILNSEAQEIFATANRLRAQLDLDQVSAPLILLAILEHGSSQAASSLVQLDVDGSAVLESIKRLAAKTGTRAASDNTSQFSTPKEQFSAALIQIVDRAFQLAQDNGRSTAAPEHILFKLRFNYEVQAVLTEAEYDPNAISEKLYTSLAPLIFNSESPSNPTSVFDWFSQSSIDVVNAALSKSRDRETVSANNLLEALLQTPDILPKRLTGVMQALLADKCAEYTAEVQTPSPDLQDEFTKIVKAAFRRSRQLGKASVEPQDLLFAYVDLSRDSQLAGSALLALPSNDRLFHMVFNELTEGKVAPREIAPSPLIVSQQEFRVTKRLAEILIASQKFAFQRSGSEISLADMISAMLDAARRFGSPFATPDRKWVEDYLSNSHGERTGLPAVVPGWSSAVPILRSALGYAESFYSNQVDMGHLGLALLDCDSELITETIWVLDERGRRDFIRRRLTWCVTYGGLNISESETMVLNIANLQSLSDAPEMRFDTSPDS